MTLTKIAFIVNPHAGNGSAGSNWPFIEALAKDRLGHFEIYMTQKPGDAVMFAKDAIAKEARLLVCVGGDGTLNEVVNGIMMHGESIRSDVTLGFVPDGTGCDFVRTVPIPQNTEHAIDLIAGGPVRSIDLGRLSFRDHLGHESHRYFHNITSFGLGGEVAQRVNRTTKAFGPFISFMWATLISIFLYGKKRIRIRVDNGFEQEFIVWNVAVANGQYHGGGMWVAPDASVHDGLFNVTVIGDLTIAEVFLNLSKLYNGRIYDIDKVVILTGQKVEALSDQRVLLDVDGEQPGTLPIVIDMVHDALKIITT
ncbi:MAG: diacylglycerol kinase family lipid kinase [Deltaproteobacteria bacterium]|nr:diacylglycerol kinase family lipid kinase [Deltaproteobacteria bacterium]